MVASVFIVGGEGFVGSHIVRRCLREGHAVTTFGPPMEVDLLGESGARVQRVHDDAQDYDALCGAMRASKAQAVVWTAGFSVQAKGLMASGETDAARTLAINVGGWANVLRAAAQCGVARVVACGSTVVFGAATDYPDTVDELSPPLPRTMYGLSKSLAETTAQYYARTSRISCVTLRLPLVFGPGRWYGGAATMMVRLIEAAARNQPIELTVPAEPFDLLYVKDAADAVLHMLKAPEVAPVYHVNGFTTSYVEMAEVLQRLRPGFRATIHATPSPWTWPLMRTRLIEQEQQYRPSHDLEAALRDYLKET